MTMIIVTIDRHPIIHLPWQRRTGPRFILIHIVRNARLIRRSCTGREKKSPALILMRGFFIYCV
jgi:hypothetical protein